MACAMGFISIHYGFAADAGEQQTYFDSTKMNRVSVRHDNWTVSAIRMGANEGFYQNSSIGPPNSVSTCPLASSRSQWPQCSTVWP